MARGVDLAATKIRERRSQPQKDQENSATEQPADQPTPPDALRGDYALLEALLKAGKWQEADQETAQQMCLVMGRQTKGWLEEKDIKQFPCADLRAIDQLWVTHSNGKFGFSVQKKIWQQCGSPTYGKEWERFGEAVGWLSKGLMGIILGASWKSYRDLTFDTSAPKGHLPVWRTYRSSKVGGVISYHLSLALYTGVSRTLLSREDV